MRDDGRDRGAGARPRKNRGMTAQNHDGNHSQRRSLRLTDGEELVAQLPVLDATLGPNAMDVRTFLGTTGLCTFDPSFNSTASCRSAITFVDGDKGVLLYRGYPIEELAQH